RWRNDRKQSINEDDHLKEEVKPKTRASLKEVGKAFLNAIWGLLVPVIILGGIYGGYFTPTEAAVVSVFYGLFVGMVIYRTINFKKLYIILIDSGVQTAIVMFVVATASIFAHIITTERYARDISALLL